MLAKNLAEKLFYKKDWTKLFRVTEHFNTNKQLKIVDDEENKPQEKIGTKAIYGSIYIVENPNPEAIYFEEEFIDKKDNEF